MSSDSSELGQRQNAGPMPSPAGQSSESISGGFPLPIKPRIVASKADNSIGRLLVLDDELDFANFVGSVAKDIGFQVLVAGSGDEFKSTYDAFSPDVVSIDMIMPDVDGVQLLEFLSKRKCRAEIIIISGFTPFYLHCARELSFGLGLKTPTLMSKPVHLKDLRHALLEAVGKS